MNNKELNAFERLGSLVESVQVRQSVNRVTPIFEEVMAAHDGKVYAIIRESSGYVIKQSKTDTPKLAEDFDYIGGVKNRGKYIYSDKRSAMQSFNMLNCELRNSLSESLLKEAEDKKKHVLKLKKK